MSAKLSLPLFLPSFLDVSLASLALSVTLPVARVLASLDRTFDALPGPRRDPREAFERLLRSLTEDTRLVLHVVSSAQLPEPLRFELLEQVRRNRRLLLVFSCQATEASADVAPRITVHRLDVGPLDAGRLRAVLEHRFSPNSFPDEFYDALLRHTGGWTRNLSAKLVDLVAANLIVGGGRSAWRLSEPLVSERWAREFGSSFYAPVLAVLRELDDRRAKHVEDFFSLAALCGEAIPVSVVLEHVGVEPEERDGFLDLIDDRFGPEASPPFFRDHEFQHPTFPGQLVYSFVNPALRAAVLDRLSAAEVLTQAGELLHTVRRKLPPLTRGIAALHLELARLSASADVQVAAERELAWWVGIEEAERLTQSLGEGVAAGRISPDAVWGTAERSAATWPPYRRLALVNAFARQPGGVAYSFLPRYHAVKATILFQLKRLDAAEDSARAGLDALVEPRSRLGAQFHVILADIAAERGDFEEGLRDARLGVEIAEECAGPSDPLVGSALETLGTILRAVGQTREAYDRLERALVIHEGNWGPDHPAVVPALNAFGGINRELGRPAEAARCFERCVAIAEAAYGPRFPWLPVMLDNLGLARLEVGDVTGALQCCERALDLALQAFGPDHPDVAKVLSNLSAIHGAVGEHEKAEAELTRAIAVYEGALGPDNPFLAVLWDNLGVARSNLGRAPEAVEASHRALSVAEKFFPPSHPTVLRILGNLAARYAEVGDVRGRADCLLRIARARAALGPGGRPEP